MKIETKSFILKLAHTFTISRESHNTQETLITCIHHNGYTGYGEATANPYYKITTQLMAGEIANVKEKLESYPFTTPEDFHDFLCTLPLSNFTICALDLAANDLYGKIQGKPLYALWNTSIDTYPVTNYTIGIASIDKMIEKMKEKPWPLYKIKLGTDHDVEIIQKLRAHTDAQFRVDANCAWSPEETIENAIALKELGVEFIEQPLKADNWSGMKKVMEKSVLPVIADESCILESDVDLCKGHFHGINIKLVKCGGLTPARRMIANAKSSGLKVMVGCMTESTVGISAIAQLLPQLDYVDMDGALLLKEDIATGVSIKTNGKLAFPAEGGSGINLLEE